MGSEYKSQVRVEDRISELPDKVVCHILSYLPTKYAVRTSVLSKRWKKKWASVPNLDFDDRYFQVSHTFMMFVDHVLFLRNSSDVQKFRLQCSRVRNVAHIDGWIRTAIMRNVVEIDLNIRVQNEILLLPKSLFTCQTLLVLKLGPNIAINTPTSWRLCNLKSLYLKIDHPHEDIMKNLLPNCPKLEDLALEGILGAHVALDFNIAALNLKTLKICVRTGGETHVAKYDQCKLFINAPNLSCFDLAQYVFCNCILENAEFLVKANICLYHHHPEEHPILANRATALFERICNVKYLSISAHCLGVSHLPNLGNLNQLELVLHHCCSSWPELLEKSRNLEHLIIKHAVLNCEGYCCGLNTRKELKWNQPTLLPTCLYLKTICFKAFKGRRDEFEVARYLLKTGKVLSRVTFYLGNTEKKAEMEMCRKLLMFKRGSKTCQVEFATMRF